VLEPIWDEDFLGFSYGFRPGRKQHDALDALYVGITSKKVNYVLESMFTTTARHTSGLV
jgi:retron-type reverse transcriptase